MIHSDHYSEALRILQGLIVQAKHQAYEAGEETLAQLLNDIELLPELVADEADRTDEFIEMLHGIAQVHPNCRYLVEGFETIPTAAP